jgi:tRNA A-37 threonylcarbamoyl transferase component Bud32
MEIKSRKHYLALVDGHIVKGFDNKEFFDKELFYLTACKESGIAVPEILKTYDMTIEMEYIKGILYTDLFDSGTEEQIQSLCDWIYRFHKRFNVPRCDMNLRNFIWNGTECVGIDFADPLDYSDIEHDIGTVLCFIMSKNEGVSDRRLELARYFFDWFLNKDYEEKLIRNGYMDEIERIKVRRKKFWNDEFTLADKVEAMWNILAIKKA